MSTSRHHAHQPRATPRASLRPRTTPAEGDGSTTALVHGWPALVVVHDADGDWHLMAEHPDTVARSPHADVTPSAQRLEWSRAVQEDPRLRELVGLSRGWVASRETPTQPWRRSPG